HRECAATQRKLLESRLDSRKLLEQRSCKPSEHVTDGRFNLWPHEELRPQNGRLTRSAQRDGLLPVVAMTASRLHQPHRDKSRQRARHRGLANLHSLSQLAHRERSKAVQRGEQRIMPGLHRKVGALRDTRHIGLHALRQALQATTEEKEAAFGDDVAGFEHRYSPVLYVALYSVLSNFRKMDR